MAPVEDNSDDALLKDRGTIILCDQLYPTVGNKWVIAGTYDTAMAAAGAREHIISGFWLYLRLQCETVGEKLVNIKLVVRDLPPTYPALHETDLKRKCTNPVRPMEFGYQFPGISVQCPVEPEEIEVGKPLALNLLFWLKVNGASIASSPLTIIFRNPNDHTIPFARKPDPGGGP